MNRCKRRLLLSDRSIIDKARSVGKMSGAVLAAGVMFSGVLVAEASPSAVVNEQTKTVKQNQVSQTNVDTLAEQKSNLLDEFRLVISETESLRVYNDQMQKLIESQLVEAESIKKQISQIEETNQQVVPLMIRMIESLEAFVALDVPFLKEERSERMKSLRTMMDQANVSTSEKFRRVMEAFQVENEYGRSIEAYRADVKADGSDASKTVDFLRIGRVVLIYQTLDGKEAKIWNQKTKTWDSLDDSYRSAIQDGLKIARKQAAPDLLTLPIPSPTKAEGA